MHMLKCFYQLCNEWSIWRSYLSYWWPIVKEASLMEIIWKRMSFVTCLDWKISSSTFDRSCHWEAISLIYQLMKMFDAHQQGSQSTQSSRMSITFATMETAIITSIQLHIHWSNINMWATIFQTNYSAMFELFHYSMNDRSSIHFSCVWHNHFHRWQNWLWRMRQHNWRNKINNHSMRMSVFQWFDILACENFIFCVFMMIT